MVHEEIDEKVEAQKKKDIIEFRNKKRTSRIFLFAVTIYEIVETILVVLLLFLFQHLLFLNFLEIIQNLLKMPFQLLLL